jgi:hypothetical protein
MSEIKSEPRSFADQEAEADRISKALPEQIAKLRAEIQTAKARLRPTAREEARDSDGA